MWLYSHINVHKICCEILTHTFVPAFLRHLVHSTFYHSSRFTRNLTLNGSIYHVLYSYLQILRFYLVGYAHLPLGTCSCGTMAFRSHSSPCAILNLHNTIVIYFSRNIKKRCIQQEIPVSYIDRWAKFVVLGKLETSPFHILEWTLMLNHDKNIYLCHVTCCDA